MQPSKLVSKQKPVTAAVDAPGDGRRTGRMVAGVTTLQRGTTRPNTEEATCIVRDGPKGGKREGAGAEEKNVADGSGERGKSSQGRPSPGEREKEGRLPGERKE